MDHDHEEHWPEPEPPLGPLGPPSVHVCVESHQPQLGPWHWPHVLAWLLHWSAALVAETEATTRRSRSAAAQSGASERGEDDMCRKELG